MKWRTLFLCLLLSKGALAFDLGYVGEYRISSTLLDIVTPEEARFATVVGYHFTYAQKCWKPRYGVPKESTINKLIVGCIKAKRLHWSNEADKMYKFFAIVVSESGGHNVGNPDDPSYGVCHTKYETAKRAAEFFNIPAPKRRSDFVDKLSKDILFNMECGAGALVLAQDEVRGDWVRAVLVYKMGYSKLNRTMNGLAEKNIPITQIDVWRNYEKLYLWMKCVYDKVVTDSAPDDNCGCLTAEAPI